MPVGKTLTNLIICISYYSGTIMLNYSMADKLMTANMMVLALMNASFFFIYFEVQSFLMASFKAHTRQRLAAGRLRCEDIYHVHKRFEQMKTGLSLPCFMFYTYIQINLIMVAFLIISDPSKVSALGPCAAMLGQVLTPPPATLKKKRDLPI